MAAGQVALQEIVGQTVTGLGYELVEIERSAGGLLRVTIDLPWVPGAAEEPFVTVEDCEKVTRQLQFALEVDGIEYRRLEVSSPGIDRPLRSERDFERFAGSVVDIRRPPMPAVGDTGETLLAGATIAGWLLAPGRGASCSGLPSVGVTGGGGSLPVCTASALIGAGGGASVGSAGGSRAGGVSAPGAALELVPAALAEELEDEPEPEEEEEEEGEDEAGPAAWASDGAARGACATATAARRPSARDGDEARMVGAGL